MSPERGFRGMKAEPLPKKRWAIIDETDPDGKVMEYASRLIGSCDECGCATELGESLCWDCVERISQQ